MPIHPEKITGTTSGGSLSANTVSLNDACYQIIAKPATNSTVFDLTITDPDGAVIYAIYSQTGILSEPVTLLLNGIYTVAIANASADEQFIIKLMIQE